MGAVLGIMNSQPSPANRIGRFVPGTIDALFASGRGSHRRFFCVSAMLFAISVLVTIVWSTSMAAMAGMRMPGGWTMSMAWMHMPGRTWSGTAVSFVGMSVTVNHDPVKTVIYKEQRAAKQPCERLHRSPPYALVLTTRSSGRPPVGSKFQISLTSI